MYILSQGMIQIEDILLMYTAQTDDTMTLTIRDGLSGTSRSINTMPFSKLPVLLNAVLLTDEEIPNTSEIDQYFSDFPQELKPYR